MVSSKKKGWTVPNIGACAMNPKVSDALIVSPAGGAVLVALELLLDRDAYLLEVDANERSITARLAMYLQGQLPTWHVDCEYNRDEVNPKRLRHFHLDPNGEDTEAKTVFPDIIVHMRGKKENLLVIEVKKTTNTVPRDVDYAKLQGYKRDLNYQHALFIELAICATPDVRCVKWIA